jgi:hypothetical protein
MAESQKAPVVPPQAGDSGLIAYTTNIRRNIEDLYLDAHTHTILTAAPKSTDGAISDIKIVNDGTHVYLVIKNNDGKWYKSANLTAL